MKWIEKIFGKKELEQVEIRFEELPAWLASVKDGLSESRHAASVYSSIKDALEEIGKSASELEKAEPEGRFHLKMVKIATSNRDNMVKQVRLLMNNINVPESTDIKTVLEFHENAIQTLTMCLENMMKSYQYTKMVFHDDSKNVIAEVNELGRLLNRLIEPITDNRKVLEAFENAEITIGEIKNTYSRIDTEKKMIGEFDEKIKNLKKNIDSGNADLAHIKESKEWGLYIECRNDLLDLENEASKLEAEIKGLFLPLNKPLSRIKQLNEDGRYDLEPAIKKELLSFLSDPKSVKPEFFIDIENIILKDTGTFNPDKRDKILEQIWRAGERLKVFNNEYQTIISHINSKKNEMAGMNIFQEDADLRSRISAQQEDMASAEKEMEISKKHLKSLEDDLTAKTNELQKAVFVIDNRKKILY